MQGTMNTLQELKFAVQKFAMVFSSLNIHGLKNFAIGLIIFFWQHLKATVQIISNTMSDFRSEVPWIELTHVGINKLLVGVSFHGFASHEFREL